MESLIGSKITIEYYDQNEGFARILPRSGEIISRHHTENVDDWYLVELEDPFDYNGRENARLLVRSRWKGETLENGDTSVFILLIPDPALVNENEIELEKLEHVAWGLAKLPERT